MYYVRSISHHNNGRHKYFFAYFGCVVKNPTYMHHINRENRLYDKFMCTYEYMQLNAKTSNNLKTQQDVT